MSAVSAQCTQRSCQLRALTLSHSSHSAHTKAQFSQRSHSGLTAVSQRSHSALTKHQLYLDPNLIIIITQQEPTLNDKNELLAPQLF